MRPSKKLIAAVLVVVMLSSVLAFPVSAAVVPEIPIEPNYVTVKCIFCGSTARVTDSNYGVDAGISSVGKCKYYSGSHTHSLYRDYVDAECPICGDINMLYHSYEVCDIAGIQVN